MTGNYSSTLSQGSNGIFTGSFGAVDEVKTLVSEYHAVLMQAIKDAAKEETQRVRQAASDEKSPWNSIADSLNVDFDYNEGQFVYGVQGDEKTQQKAMDLEYGTLENAPAPLLRSSAIQGQYDLSLTLDSKVNNELGKRY
jgi:hypothetical protein